MLLRDVDERGALGGIVADVVHHVGVLYHLADPVAHILELPSVGCSTPMLDTHVARPDEATESMVVEGATYAYRRYGEGGRTDAFSGMSDHARWLTIEGLEQALGAAGFGSVEVAERRDERNGLRVLVFAERPVSSTGAGT